MSPLPASVSGARLSSRVGMAGTKPGFEWDVPEDRDVDAGDEARPHVEPPAPRPHDASVGGEDDAARVIYGEVCAICRDDVTRRGRIDACDHLFCLPCIKRWANIETKCPLCKARFSFIQPEDLVPPDPDARPSTRGAQRAELKRVYLPHKDQVYEGDGELPDGVDIEEVLCGRCGDGGDEDKLMLCDGCDQGYHCYCVGLDAVPLDEWRCQICADEDGDDGAEAQPASTQEDETAARDEAMARGLQRAEDAAAARAERDDLIAAARERAARLRNARNARRGGTTSGATAVRTVGSYRRTHAHDDDDEEEDANEDDDDSLRHDDDSPFASAPGARASRGARVPRTERGRQPTGTDRARRGAAADVGAVQDGRDRLFSSRRRSRRRRSSRRADRARPDRGQQNGRLGAGASSRGAQPRGWEPAQTRGSTRGTRVLALGASTRELKRPASRRARGVNSVQLTSSSTPGDASPFSPVAASEWVNPPPPDAQRRRTNVDTRGTYQRRPGGRPRAYTLPAVVGSIGAAGGRGSRPASRSRRRDPTPTFTTHLNGAGPTIPTTNHPRRRHRVDPSHAKVGHRRCHVAGMTSRPRPSSRRVSSNIRKRSLDPKPRRGGSSARPPSAPRTSARPIRNKSRDGPGTSCDPRGAAGGYRRISLKSTPSERQPRGSPPPAPWRSSPSRGSRECRRMTCWRARRDGCGR